jgi:hypothetical protein
MLAVVVIAGLLPDTGAVSASSNCTYGKCPAASPFPIWSVSAAAAIVVLALIIALLLLRRNRRRPPPAAPDTGTTGPGAATTGGATGTENPAAPTQPWEPTNTPSDSTGNFDGAPPSPDEVQGG